MDVRKRSVAIAPLLASIVFCALPAAAQGQQEVLYVDELGDIRQAKTSSQAKLHVRGELKLLTADYFRGLFDGVQEDLGDLAVQPDLLLIAELHKGQDWLRGLNLTAGIHGGLSDPDPFTNVGDPDVWYEADSFIGLVGDLQQDFRLALTYTAYTVPNDIIDTRQEFALALQYAGDNPIGKLKPQAKIAEPIDGADGSYVSGMLTPQFKLFSESAYPLTVKVPIEVGVGFDDYYGPGTDSAVFGSVGLLGSVPLKFIPADYGSWEFTAGVRLVVREQDIVDAGGPFDDAENTVVIGTVGIAFTY